MGNSDDKDFNVFSFKEEDEIIESVSGSLLEKFTNSNHSESLPSHTKYNFLECLPREAEIQQMQGSRNLDDQADVISEEDGCVRTSSPSSSSDLGEIAGLDDPATKSCSLDWQMETVNVAVVVSPDYVIHDKRYCTESLLTFSCSCIMLEGSNACADKGSFSSEWLIFDVKRIESQWCGVVGIAFVKLFVRDSSAIGASSSSGATDIVELKFAVHDRQWPQKQENILSLNPRYKDVWEVTMDTDMETEDIEYAGQNSSFSSADYFSNYDKHFEDVVYPKGDPDAVSISKRDVELLQPEIFLNDTLIDFYIKYLKSKIPPEDHHRFHFFNSFFFRKLADLDKDPSSASEGRAAFLRVRKWTRKVNLFEKDYIFIPINFNLHWSLIVICHPGEIANSKDEEADDSRKVPCIMHMDSIKGSHKGLKNLIQSYLWEEWKERKPESPEVLSSKFLNLRFVPLELPQQENSFDCGLFLLHYVECFLEEAPLDFSPFRISKSCNFLSTDWFPPSEASFKRACFRKLIRELIKDHSLEVPQDSRGDVHHSSGFSQTDLERENGLVFLPERCGITDIGDNNSSFPAVEQGIEIKLLEKAPLSDVQFGGEQGLILREFFEPGTSPGGQYLSFDQNGPLHTTNGGMSPIEEIEEETTEQVAFSPSGAAGSWPLVGLTFEDCPPTTSHLSKTVTDLEHLVNPDCSMGLEEQNHASHPFPVTSTFMSQNLFEFGVNVLPPVTDSASQNEQEAAENTTLVSPEYSSGVRESPASSEHACGIVKDPKEMEKPSEVNESEESLSFKKELREQSFSNEAENLLGDNLQFNGADDDDHQHIAKRPKTIPSAEV